MVVKHRPACRELLFHRLSGVNRLIALGMARDPPAIGKHDAPHIVTNMAVPIRVASQSVSLS
jgi:hypothetical protein